MNLNPKICIIVHKSITKCIAPLRNGIFQHSALILQVRNAATCLWAWKHYLTYKLVWKSMNSAHKICIMAHKAIYLNSWCRYTVEFCYFAPKAYVDF